MRKVLLVMAIVAFLTAPFFAQVQVAPMLNPKPQFFTATGNPLSGGKIYFYQAGTTTPLPTYTSAGGSILNPNPVTLDAGGFPQNTEIWLGPNTYKVVAKDSTGVVQWTVDNVTSLSSPIFARTNVANSWTSDQNFGKINAKQLSTVYMASQYAGADACLKIKAAISDSPSVGASVVADFSGNVSCSVNPFENANKSVTLYLPAGVTFQTTAKWQTQAGYKQSVIGSGRGDSGAHGTVIQAVGGFPTDGTSVVQIGGSTAGTATHGSTFERMTIDCNGIAKVGAFSADANEMSGLKRVVIASCSSKGFDFTTMNSLGGAQNFVVDEVEVYPQSYGTTSTVCGNITGNVTGPQRISNLTCVANSAAPSTSCFTLDSVASGVFSSIHSEQCEKAINLGSNGIVDGILIENATGGPGVTTVIDINNPASQNIMVLSVSKLGSTNALVNSVSGRTFTDDKLTFYAYGNGASPRPEFSITSGNNSILPSIAMLGDLNINGHAIVDGSCISSSSGLLRGCAGSTVNFKNYAGDGDVSIFSKDSFDVVHIGGSAGAQTDGLLHALGGITTGVSGSSNKAVCWKDASHLGYCSTQPDGTGACTCN